MASAGRPRCVFGLPWCCAPRHHSQSNRPSMQAQLHESSGKHLLQASRPDRSHWSGFSSSASTANGSSAPKPNSQMASPCRFQPQHWGPSRGAELRLPKRTAPGTGHGPILAHTSAHGHNQRNHRIHRCYRSLLPHSQRLLALLLPAPVGSRLLSAPVGSSFANSSHDFCLP